MAQAIRIVVALIATLATGASTTARPTADAFVRGKVNELADLLQSGDANRFEVVRQRIAAVADFEGFAERALGPTWAKISPAERRDFQAALQELLESHYMNKPGNIFDKRKVHVDGAAAQGEHTIVHATVKRRDVDIEVRVELSPTPEAWRVEDVVIDELSLLEDYQAQFRILLKKKSVSQITARLRQKAKENSAATAASRRSPASR